MRKQLACLTSTYCCSPQPATAVRTLPFKRHHEHTSTALPTNFHFTATDLFLEGFVPFFVGLHALEKIEGKVCSPFEHFLLIA